MFSAHIDPSSAHDDDRRLAKSRVLALRCNSKGARRDMSSHGYSPPWRNQPREEPEEEPMEVGQDSVMHFGRVNTRRMYVDGRRLNESSLTMRASDLTSDDRVTACSTVLGGYAVYENEERPYTAMVGHTEVAVPFTGNSEIPGEMDYQLTNATSSDGVRSFGHLTRESGNPQVKTRQSVMDFRTYVSDVLEPACRQRFSNWTSKNNSLRHRVE